MLGAQAVVGVATGLEAEAGLVFRLCSPALLRAEAMAPKKRAAEKAARFGAVSWNPSSESQIGSQPLSLS